MLYDGVSKRHCYNIFKIEKNKRFMYYEKHCEIIKATVFKDSFFTFRFVRLFVDLIKKTHNTLASILKSQYRNADYVYHTIFILNADKDVFEALKLCERDKLVQFTNDIETNLIEPILQRHGIYSPNLISIITYMLICFTGEVYSPNYIQKEKYRMQLKMIENLESFIKFQSIFITDDQLILDELHVWSSIGKRRIT